MKINDIVILAGMPPPDFPRPRTFEEAVKREFSRIDIRKKAGELTEAEAAQEKEKVLNDLQNLGVDGVLDRRIAEARKREDKERIQKSIERQRRKKRKGAKKDA